MLPNTLVLNYPIIASGNAVDVAVERSRNLPLGAVYKFPDDQADRQHRLKVGVNEPKATGNFQGVRKAESSLTRWTTVNGVDSSTQLKVPIVFKVSVSLPLGVSAEDCGLAYEEFKAYIGSKDFFLALCEKQEI